MAAADSDETAACTRRTFIAGIGVGAATTAVTPALASETARAEMASARGGSCEMSRASATPTALATAALANPDDELLDDAGNLDTNPNLDDAGVPLEEVRPPQTPQTRAIDQALATGAADAPTHKLLAPHVSDETRERVRAFDEAFDQQQQQGGGVGDGTVTVTGDLGIDGTGNSGVVGDELTEAFSGLSNVRVEFPKNGVFPIEDEFSIDPEGPIEVIGNGSRIKIKPNTLARGLNATTLPGGSTIKGLIVDQSASGARASIRIGTKGKVKFADCKMEGYAPPKPVDEDYATSEPGTIFPIARGSDAAVRVQNFEAVGGTAAGMHSDPDKPESAPENRLGAPMGMWVGTSSKGTVQLINSRLRGWSNGTYSGRTKGRVEVLGGTLWNNSNTQVRVGGNSLVEGTTLLADGSRWSKKRNPGPYTLGVNQGVHCVRVDTGGDIGNQTDPAIFKRLAMLMPVIQKTVGMVDIEGDAGPTKFNDIRMVNGEDVPAIRASAPGSKRGEPAPRTTVSMTNITIEGMGDVDTPAVNIIDRPSSTISNSCLKYKGASQSDIEGASVSNCTFGPNCSGTGASKKAGNGIGAIDKLAAVANVIKPGSGALVRAVAGLGKQGGMLAIFAAFSPLITVVMTIALIVIPLIVLTILLLGLGHVTDTSRRGPEEEPEDDDSSGMDYTPPGRMR